MGGRTPADDRAGMAGLATVGRRAPWCLLGGATLVAATFLLHASPAAALTAPAPLTTGADSGPLVSLFAQGDASSSARTVSATGPSTATPEMAPEPTPSNVRPSAIAASADLAGTFSSGLDAALHPVTAVASSALPSPVLLPDPVRPRPAANHRVTLWPHVVAPGRPVATVPAPAVVAVPVVAAPGAAPAVTLSQPGGPAPATAVVEAAPAPIASGTPATAPGPAAAPPTEPAGGNCPTGIPPVFWVLNIAGETTGAGDGTETAALPPASAPNLVPAHVFVWGTPYRAADTGGTRPGHARAPPEERRCPVC